MRCPARSIAVLLLSLDLSACTSWKLQTVTPDQAFADSSYVRRGVRVTTLDSQKVEIRHPTLRNEAITGWSRRGGPVAVPLQNIGKLEVKRPDAGKDVMLVLGSAAGAVVLTYAAVCIALCGSD
jgi:hypothetical protein